MYKVVSVTHNDERQLVGQFGLLQEVLYSLWGVAVAFAANALNLLDLASLARSLDVLEVDLGVLGEVDDGTEEVEETFEGLEGLKKVDESISGELLVVLSCHLDADL